MAAIRRAEAHWQGDLLTRSGAVSASTSRAFTELPVTWASRTEEANGRTSPEELLAAVYDGRRFEDGKPIARTIGKEAA